MSHVNRLAALALSKARPVWSRSPNFSLRYAIRNGGRDGHCQASRASTVPQNGVCQLPVAIEGRRGPCAIDERQYARCTACSALDHRDQLGYKPRPLAPQLDRQPMPPPVHVIGGGLAGSEAAWQLAAARRAGGAARDAAGAADRCAPDRQAGRAGLLQLVPLRRPHGQRRGPAARGDAAAGLADHGHGRSAQAAGRRGAGGRPGRLRRRRYRRRSRPSPW